MNPFDEIIPRHKTASIKYDGSAVFHRPEGLLPMWVADMDFRAPEPVLQRLGRCVEHGIFGYGLIPDSYYEAVMDWFKDHFGLAVQRSWILTTPGVVFALAAGVRAFTEPGDAVLINRPVYYPFSNVIRDNGRTLVNSPLKLADGRYEMDFEDMERKIKEHQVKLYILCSPHNPVGRVWTEDELRRAGDLCRKYGVTVISDEIHCDFVWSDHPHTCFASLGPEYADSCMVCTSPSKTFNLAGLQVSNILIPDQKRRMQFKKELRAQSAPGPGVMGMQACEAAYREGLAWLEKLRGYLRENIALVRSFTEKELPGIHLIEPEGTYLLWLDMRQLGLTEEALEDFITRAGLWLDGGTMFGPEGLGFQRINIACPRSLVQQAMEQLREALKTLR